MKATCGQLDVSTTDVGHLWRLHGPLDQINWNRHYRIHR